MLQLGLGPYMLGEVYCKDKETNDCAMKVVIIG